MVVHCCGVYIQYTVYFISFLCCVQLITNIVSFANPITCHLKKPPMSFFMSSAYFKMLCSLVYCTPAL